MAAIDEAERLREAERWREAERLRAVARTGFGALTRPTSCHPLTVGAYEVRYLAVAELIEQGRVMSPTEMATRIAGRGVMIHGRPAKVVSDALRREVVKGRVRKVGWGRYTVGDMPPSTRSWIQARAARHLDLIAALNRLEQAHR